MVELLPGIEVSMNLLLAAVAVVLLLVAIVIILTIWKKKKRQKQITIEEEEKEQMLSPEEQMRKTIIEEEKAKPEEPIISSNETELGVEEAAAHFAKRKPEEKRELKPALKPQSSLNDVDRLVSLLGPKKSQYSKQEIRQVLEEEGYSKEMQDKVLEKLGI